MAKMLILESCSECPHHKVLPDPDPDDSFCFDDVKVVCGLRPEYLVTGGCRPYNVQKETTPMPSWCPLPDSK